jgi:ABC-type multidrug transport system ATPase subunit
MKIRIEQVSKDFAGVWALEEVTLDLEPGQVVGVLGANGAGKTTLLNCLAGIVAPSRGRIYYDGEIFNRGKMSLRRRLMFLPDFPMAFARMNVLQHIAMCVRLFERPEPDAQNVARILDQLNILVYAGMPLGSMSRGQLYKAGLAGLLVVDPELWILDEPLASGMDPMGIAFFKREAKAAAQRGRTVVYTTQILEIAEKFSDRICVLDHGGLRLNGRAGEMWGGEGQGSLEEVLLRLRDPDVRR